MRTHWNTTEFANWIRGTKKPGSGSAHEWVEWDNKAKELHPIRFWIAEEGLDEIQSFVRWPWEKILAVKYYINNRFVSQTHALVAHKDHIKRGQWCDVTGRMLPCLFDTLVDFVEVELAWWHIAWADKETSKKYKAPFWARGIFRIRTWRCPQAGLDNLEWASKLVYDEDCGIQPADKLYGKPTSQAEGAQEILALYHWYKEVYLKRPDPMDASGYSAICDSKRERVGKSCMALFDHENETKEEKAAYAKASKLLHKIEKDYEKEDTEMMCRLIKVRDHLWT